MLPATESTAQVEVDPSKHREEQGAMLLCVQGCLIEDRHPSCSPALQLPPCCADPTETHAGVSFRTEIPVPSLVPGSWIIVGSNRNAHFGVCSWCVAADMQWLAKSSSGWNFSLGHLDLNFKHKPLSHLFRFACIVPLSQQPPGTKMFSIVE